MPILKKDPTLKDFRLHVKELEIKRGLAREDIFTKYLFLGKEIGIYLRRLEKRWGK